MFSPWLLLLSLSPLTNSNLLGGVEVILPQLAWLSVERIPEPSHKLQLRHFKSIDSRE